MRRMVCGLPEEHVEQDPQRSLQPLELKWKYEPSIGGFGGSAPRQHSELVGEKNCSGRVEGFVNPCGTVRAVQRMGVGPTEQIVRDAGVPAIFLFAPGGDRIFAEAGGIQPE